MTVTNFEFRQQRRDRCREDAINMFRVRTTVIELVTLAATVVVHCTLSKHRENLFCSLVVLKYDISDEYGLY